MTTIPRYVALCGAPKAGKTTIAELLHWRYRAIVVDDGSPLRDAVSVLFAPLGVQSEDPWTQEGKAKRVEVCGKPFTVRQLLGDLGNMLEDFYSQQLMPELAIASLKARLRAPGAFAPDSSPFYIFPSCRKTQGITYRKHGGLVVEITRPGCVPVHDFDHYDKSRLTHSIANDADLDMLKHRVFEMFDAIYGAPQ